ncbi:hypothetical protein HZH68_005494 [Vespula germanica]|uniref:Uncharacterized protein n=1 Tax=Vespula germanica TaxID=30212 RepID=A0A834NDJ4_VESGE|nr:hypothetical protein HZH68_005494 [Vespula germanica]
MEDSSNNRSIISRAPATATAVTRVGAVDVMQRRDRQSAQLSTYVFLLRVTRDDDDVDDDDVDDVDDDNDNDNDDDEETLRKFTVIREYTAILYASWFPE